MSEEPTLSVNLVTTAGGRPIASDGHAKFRSSEVIELEMSVSFDHLNDGSKVILSFPDAELPRMEAIVREVSGHRLLCSTQRLREAERRDYPRLHAGVPLRYRAIRGAGSYELSCDWIEGSDAPLKEGDWVSPDEFMNFSVTGLAFHGDDSVQPDDLLLIELQLRGHIDPLRATARVIRIFTLEEAERDGHHTHRIAVQFENLPDSAHRALSDLTLDIQDSLF